MLKFKCKILNLNIFIKYLTIKFIIMSVQVRKINEKNYYIEKISNLLIKLEINWNPQKEEYLLAFIHRSLVNERSDFSKNHNERLEFLWDAVLELCITKHLYNDYPETPEWELTDFRSSLVKWKNLAKISKEIWLNDYMILWKWEELWWWRDNDYLLANCLEAFIWAIYLDLWFEEAEKFVLKYIYSSLNSIINNDLLKDYKSILQEYTQRVFFITPEYKVIKEEWLDHEKNYTSWVYLNELLIWTWNWSSKKKSQEDAAKNAFLNKENINLKKKNFKS